MLAASLRCLLVGLLGLIWPDFSIRVASAKLSRQVRSKVDAFLGLELLVAIAFDTNAIVSALGCRLLLGLLHSRLLRRFWI